MWCNALAEAALNAVGKTLTIVGPTIREYKNGFLPYDQRPVVYEAFAFSTHTFEMRQWWGGFNPDNSLYEETVEDTIFYVSNNIVTKVESKHPVESWKSYRAFPGQGVGDSPYYLYREDKNTSWGEMNIKKIATQIPMGSIRPGDFIYWEPEYPKTSHIAVYIGNGQAVHGGWDGPNVAIAGIKLQRSIPSTAWRVSY
ncbi:C40 family peptidase [Candidatus Saccharibacteria bacterium]|nr:C40 family peptidase [Candidatus Saccharibacteria bacterium]